MEDRNENRRRELEEILELRRSFGTLGRRLVNRQTPISTSLKPTVIPLGTQSATADPDAAARPDEAKEQEQAQQPEPEQAQEPEPEPEPAEPDQADQQPVQETEPDQQEDQQPELDWDRVSTAVQRIAPVVDESYRLQAQTANQPFRIPEPPAARRRPRWPWLVGLVAVFALGMAVGHVVLQPSQRSAPPASSQAAPAPSTPLSSTAPPPPQASVPPSCLVTAQRADALIDLLVRKARGIEVTRALKEYTLASQTCRKEASSR
jgi:hypothetical protein